MYACVSEELKTLLYPMFLFLVPKLYLAHWKQLGSLPLALSVTASIRTHLAMVHMHREGVCLGVNLLTDLTPPLVKDRGGAHHQGASRQQVRVLLITLILLMLSVLL
jgi:hypothetical protein